MQSLDPSLGTRRQITGVITKLVGDEATYGFINDEIFFQQVNVAGGPAGVGDQVLADCEYSAHLPIKWNANSLRIITKASGGGGGRPDMSQQQQQQVAHEPRHHSHQQNVPAQQAGGQFNQPPPVAVTYQQHRQQRMQRQNLASGDDDKHQDKPLLPQTGQPPRLLDQGGMAQPSDFFQQQQQQAGGIPPFQDQTPMGPPNFSYTSQLGSAFVGPNQFSVPPPFIAQQQQPPTPLLPQPPQMAPMLPNNQHQRGQQNKNQQGNQRFNQRDDKMDNDNRQNNNRNNNNNRRGNSRDRDRFGQQQSNNNQNNNKRKNSRDRSSGRQQQGGRDNKRGDDVPVRPSPPPHSSARSSTSVSSDRGPSGQSKGKDRKHYEVQNIPKTLIMNNMNANNMRSRCPAAVHIPSDLKEIIVNKYFRLDVKNTPKPVKYTIEKQQSQSQSQSQLQPEAVKIDDTKKPGELSDTNTSTSEQNNESISKKSENRVGDEQITPPSSKSDIKLNHKYGVKILLMSLPELNSIYTSVFGGNLDSFSNESSKNSYKRVDEVISLLCNKGSNSGHSLLGGKFDPVLDGFLEGVDNPNERNGLQPDLIATCKRIVQDQTGLDLGPCKSWSLLSTFIYNNRSDYFSPKASVEYSYIYMPQIWTMAEEYMSKLERERISHEAASETKVELDESVRPLDDGEQQQPQEQKPQEQQPQEQQPQPPVETEESKVKPVAETGETPMEQQPQEELTDNKPAQSSQDSLPSLTLETIGDLRVADLKMELDLRQVAYKPNAKKAELLALLREFIESSSTTQVGGPVAAEEQTPTESSQETIEKPVSDEPMQEEVGNKQEEEVDKETIQEAQAPQSDSLDTTGNKRKEPEETEDVGDTKKKVCPEVKKEEASKRVEPVKLIKNSFIVKAKQDQQLSMISLYEASTQIGRHDQFELSVASIILKESLIQHFSEYILTALVEDNRQKQTESSGGSSIGASSQDSSNSDSNNNSSKTTAKAAVAPVSSSTKELPVDRYINVALTYFDSTHMGYLYFEDLTKLLNNTGLTVSKRALISLVGDGDKFHYRSLPDLTPKVSPTYQYEFPSQFNFVFGLNSSQSQPSSTASENASHAKIVEHKGVVYEVEKLVQQVREAETMQVNLHERFNYAITNSDKQAEEIHLLEVNQKTLSKAIKSQNDEICDLKKERESLKRRIDELSKVLKSVSSMASDALEKSSSSGKK